MRDTSRFLLIGNNLSLDFVNTEIAANGEPLDLLAVFADFVDWTVAANLLQISQAEKIMARWDGKTTAESVLAEAKKFRKTLRQVFVGLAQGKPPSEAAIAAINGELNNQSGAIEIRATETGFEKLYRADYEHPRRLLSPIAESAADLLCYGDLTMIRKCENPRCVLFFHDTTKNHRRRWCSMAGCGNRQKAAAFYQRQREKSKSRDQKEPQVITDLF
jgi:predicted RNA-binding Zn ribbon-like protein